MSCVLQTHLVFMIYIYLDNFVVKPVEKTYYTYTPPSQLIYDSKIIFSFSICQTYSQLFSFMNYRELKMLFFHMLKLCF